jgi:regulator of sirC expression with transglutaminase-like and TPR domain
MFAILRGKNAMIEKCLLIFSLVLFVYATPFLRADDQNKKADASNTAPSKAVEQLVEKVRQSIAVITFAGRDGKRQGLGTGFVVDGGGLIATNLHVIGEARAITVELGGKQYEVSSIHASDRSFDLALLRINAKNLPSLALGDSDTLKQGQNVLAFGNPLGLTHSVVSGVVSSKREVEGRPMIQIAIPLERGNSGGPLLDLDGRVQGIVTMKSLVTSNLGFATPVNDLKKLIQKPNPIPMSRWLTIGALDPADWTPVFGAHWRQHAGHILVEGEGAGFGGRSLCLWQHQVPPLPFEIAVAVRLDDEAGAAGLVFAADGGDNHYGFYPSAGKLRLTGFAGPDVFSWKILRQEPSVHYRPGDWNTLKVRIEKDRLRCFVNGELVFETAEFDPAGAKVGLAKFRDTIAEFKNFQVDKEIISPRPPKDVVKRITQSVANISPQNPAKPELVKSLLPDAELSLRVLRDRAKLLEQEAGQLRQLAQAVHYQRVDADLVKALQGKEEDIDLVHAALLVARLDNDELDIDPYRKEIERMARDIQAALPKDADGPAKLAALNKYLFAERGFHGSRGDYYNRSNSYLNEVLDDREGIPITLSVLYMELARRLGLKMVGIPMPGHFVVEHRPEKGEGQLIDVFEGGKTLTRKEANQRITEQTGEPLTDEELKPASKKAIVIRMLHNLLSIAGRNRDAPGTLHYFDAILAIDADAAHDRLMRAVFRFQSGQKKEALEDTEWFVDHHPKGPDTERALELRRLIEREGN